MDYQSNRVVGILQPGNMWVIEKAVSDENEEIAAALRTCTIRGWTDTLSNAVPRGKIEKTENGLQIPANFSGIAPMYKLTEAGWNVIHNSHRWVIATFLIVLITLIATICPYHTNRYDSKHCLFYLKH